ncbi:sulfhydryl oxidase 1 [Eublepharis macularius]|uniref:Sulfhydryl oxidase n=1 Tax=Eublepharis macularius TaxID=481883 RepID=A0AA97JE15_EUBMA|nr:sulfhydryl oxidase 1 [Eublepharis macularius]
MPRRLSRARPGLPLPPPPAGLLLLACLLLPLPPGARSLGLYSPSDPMALLGADSLERSVFNSSSAWVVEFYASWCGHCMQFAPTWKELARDVKDWRPAVMLGAIDCAEMTNQKICSEFKITGYPTLKFFKPFSRKPDDGIRLLHHGDGIQSLRESIIANIERSEDAWPPACPPLEAFSAPELRGFFQANSVAYLALIFEKEDSFLGREVTLDMVQFDNIAVRRVLNSNEELVKIFNVTTFPSAFLVFSNGSCSHIPVEGDSRPFYRNFLRRLPGVYRGGSFRPTVKPTVEPKTTPALWKVADRKKLYMADLESAILYTLRMEAARFLFLDKERLSALKQYVAVLVKYFPGRLVVMNYLRNLDRWLGPRTNVSQSEWEEALRNKKEEPYARLPETPTWVGCQGSKPEFRGYPCSLWTLFHLLTVQEALLSPRFIPQSQVLPTMRGYIHYFFGCRECADHFEGMAAESMDRVRNKDGAILWLWSRHNRVNARLAGTNSDDPKFRKIQWPPRDLCWSCQLTINGRRMWDEREILRFFKSHFSRSNIYLDFLNRERGPPGRRGRDVEERGLAAEGNLEEGEGEKGRAAEEEFEEEAKRTAKPERSRAEKKRSGSDRLGSPELHKPSIIKMVKSTKAKEPEDDIVDLDSFSEQHYKSKALKAAAQASDRHRRSRRDTGLVLMEDESHQSFDYDAVWERLKRKGLRAQEIMSALEEEVDKDAGLTLRRSQWLRLLGIGFSRLDVSLCIVLYILSSMCLLGMYTFFRMRMRYRKGRPGFPLA